MALDVNKEYEKLIAVANDDTFVEYINRNTLKRYVLRVDFLCLVLMSTIKYPQVEPYLKDLLNNFTINELENIHDNWSILHKMVHYPDKISLNAFEIIINYGVNINIKSASNNTPAHTLCLSNSYANSSNILNLLIKYGANLNIMNKCGETILDLIIGNISYLTEEIKNYIMTLIDFGARINNPKQNKEVCDFVEHYKSLSIKPAIKK